MTHAVTETERKLPRTAPWFRVGLWLIIAMLSLQMAAATYHKHKVALQSGDSVSCYIAAHLPPDTSTAVSKVFAPCSLYFCAGALTAVLEFSSHQEYFIPRSQAPPRRSFLL